MIDFFQALYAFSSSNLIELFDEIDDEENGALASIDLRPAALALVSLKLASLASLLSSDPAGEMVELAEICMGSPLIIESSPESVVLEVEGDAVSDRFAFVLKLVEESELASLAYLSSLDGPASERRFDCCGVLALVFKLPPERVFRLLRSDRFVLDSLSSWASAGSLGSFSFMSFSFDFLSDSLGFLALRLDLLRSARVLGSSSLSPSFSSWFECSSASFLIDLVRSALSLAVSKLVLLLDLALAGLVIGVLDLSSYLILGVNMSSASSLRVLLVDFDFVAGTLVSSLGASLLFLLSSSLLDDVDDEVDEEADEDDEEDSMTRLDRRSLDDALKEEED